MLQQLNTSFRAFKKRLIASYSFDPKKYQRKGMGAYAGYLIIISYFTLLPKLFAAILPFIIEYIPNRLIMGLGNISLNIIIMLIYNGAMYFIYKAKHPFFEQYRVHNKPWPWEQNYEQWIKLLKKTLKMVVFNSVIINSLLGLPDSWNSDYKWSIEENPDTMTILWQFVFFLLMQDLFLYLGHSTLHRPQFYWIHKPHHEYVTAVSIAGEYSHPIEHIFANTFPTFIGYKALSYIYPVHCVSVWVFIVFRVVQTIDAHTGYEWSWAQSELLPFSAGSAYHNFHHTNNAGNFGSFFKFWDSVFGTNAEYIKYRLKNNEEEKRSFMKGENPELRYEKKD